MLKIKRNLIYDFNKMCNIYDNSLFHTPPNSPKRKKEIIPDAPKKRKIDIIRFPNIIN